MRRTLALAALVLATPATARDFTPDLESCAALYDVIAMSQSSQEALGNVGHSDPLADLLGFEPQGTWTEGPSFWEFSNAREIDFAGRYTTLRERSGLSELAFDIAVRGISGTPRYPAPESAEAGFPNGTPVGLMGFDPPPASATPPYGRWITACDTQHGFTPVFAFGAPAGPDHLACIVSYWTLGVLSSEAQADTTPRVQFAARTLGAADPAMTDAAIRAAVVPRVEARAQAIIAAPDSFEALVAEVHACDAGYGHASGRQ